MYRQWGRTIHPLPFAKSSFISPPLGSGVSSDVSGCPDVSVSTRSSGRSSSFSSSVIIQKSKALWHSLA